MDAAPGSADITAAFRDLQRRSGPAPRKRTRFAPAKVARQSTPGSSPPRARAAIPTSSQPAPGVAPAATPPPKPPPNGCPSPSAPNGRASPLANGLPRPRPAAHEAQGAARAPHAVPAARGVGVRGKNVLLRIADAQRAADARPRPDPRFLPGTRALDSMTEFSSSIGVSLFSNGYVRHDGVLAHSDGIAAPRAVDVLSMPRLPYDSASRMFLTALELGVLPLDEDLPAENGRKYYDGCLVAEIFDYRGVHPSVFLRRGDAWRKRGSFMRVLLRPDACNHVADIDVLTEDLDDDAALDVEAKLLLSTHPVLDLDLHPLKEPQPPLWPPWNPRKRRRGPRPAGCAERPPVSMAALMLISASDKEQVNYQLRERQSRVTESGSSSVPASPKVAASRPSAAASAAALALSQQNARRVIFSTKPCRGPGSQTDTPKTHGRLRTIRLILPDKNTIARIKQARAFAASGGGNGESTEQLIQKIGVNVSRAGRQVCIMELVSRPGRGCDVALFRGIFGDKARDVNKMSMGSIEAANIFMNQFKGILEREGYVCIHDGDPHANSGAAQQQQFEARRRAAMQHMQQQQAAAVAGNVSPAAAHSAMQQRAQAQAQKQQMQMLHQKQNQAALRSAKVIEQRQQIIRQQQLEQQRQRQAAYPQNIAQLQQQAAQQQRTANKTALNVQAAMSAAMASKNAQRYSQQLASLPRNRSPGGRPLSMAAGVALSIPPSQVPLPARGARPGDGSASPGTPIMSQMQQIQLQQENNDRKRFMEEHQKRIAGQARNRYGAQLDPSMVLAQRQQAVAARVAAATNSALAASNAIPASALVAHAPHSQGLSATLHNAIPPALLQNINALSQSPLQQQFKQPRDNSDAGSVDTAPNSRSAKR